MVKFFYIFFSSLFSDFTVHDLTDEDEFMIIACDGIWNSMTSQEAVNYVRDRLRKDEKISEIIRELFDLLLSTDTDGHGFKNIWEIFLDVYEILRHFLIMSQFANVLKCLVMSQNIWKCHKMKTSRHFMIFCDMRYFKIFWVLFFIFKILKKATELAATIWLA